MLNKLQKLKEKQPLEFEETFRRNEIFLELHQVGLYGRVVRI